MTFPHLGPRADRLAARAAGGYTRLHAGRAYLVPLAIDEPLPPGAGRRT
jgi:hypothetical protein